MPHRPFSADLLERYARSEDSAQRFAGCAAFLMAKYRMSMDDSLEVAGGVIDFHIHVARLDFSPAELAWQKGRMRQVLSGMHPAMHAPRRIRAPRQTTGNDTMGNETKRTVLVLDQPTPTL